jgi:hypothetical protein
VRCGPPVAPYDQDALTLYNGSMWVPERALYEKSAIYQRGEDLAQLLWPKSQEEINGTRSAVSTPA